MCVGVWCGVCGVCVVCMWCGVCVGVVWCVVCFGKCFIYGKPFAHYELDLVIVSS